MSEAPPASDEALLVLALAITQGLQDAVFEAMLQASAAVDRLALRDAVDAGDVLWVADLLRDAWGRGGAVGLAAALAAHLGPLVVVAANAMAAEVDAPPDATGADERWLAAYLQQRREALTDTTLLGMTSALRWVLTGLLPTRVLVDEVVALLGVRPRDWAGVVRLRDGIVQAGGPGVDRLTLVLQQRAQDLKQGRAALIAANEPWQAVQALQQRLWSRAGQLGALDRTRVRRFWIVRPDGCQQICIPIPGMNRRGVELDQPFETPLGPRLMPLMHVRCRCSVRLVRVAAPMAG